jgi:two-component system LytT family response regulator
MGKVEEMLRTIIVDDEAPARALLREYLESRDDVDIVAECGNGFEAVKAIAELAPDLVFLDIQMPKLDGFEVLELAERDVAVVFVTAYDEHAVRAFEVHAVDYLLKPFSRTRLDEAVDRVRRRLAAGAATPVREVIAAARPRSGPAPRILVREGAAVHVIPTGELDVVEARDDAVILRSRGKVYRKQRTLSEIEAQLDPARFVRVHRSFIVNVARLARIDLYAKDSRIATLTDGTKVPVSRTGYARLRELL